ncbi:MAG: hypothetical protein ISS28_05285 [Candidatus Cloacimonetes bacterium]|nr:hypothetical protein [Candidatus Cloacimonadota bacterium]MBL7086493.1 hypothetical protein [Candidatus Cloacimonadota bacterium]
MLIIHQEYLKKKYDMKSPIIGIPRLKNIPNSEIEINSKDFPSNEEFLFCIAIQNIYDPYSLPFVNIRENWDLCCKVSEGGGVLFTFNCATIPGGYSLGSKGFQFPTYNFDVDSFIGKCKQYQL